MNQKIDLHIGELILRDVPYALRHRIAAAVEHELGRLLSEQALPPSIIQGGHIPQIDIGTMQLAPDAKPDDIGAQIAQSVYGNLSANKS
jgi:hypothetical protein